MTGLDTNVIVRFLVRDDEKQAKAVYSKFKQAERDREHLFIPLVVMLETIWVLESAYGMSRSEILRSIANLRQMPILEFESDPVLERLHSSGSKCRTDLSDLLIAHSAEHAGCDTTITFDKKAAHFSLFRLLK